MHFFLPLSSIHVAHKGSVNIAQLLLSTTIMKMVSTGNVDSVVLKCFQGTKYFTEFDVHGAVHRNIISTEKPIRRTNVSNLFLFLIL